MKLGKRELIRYLAYAMVTFILTAAITVVVKNPELVHLPKVSIQKKSETWKSIPYESFTMIVLHVTAKPTDCLFAIEECNVPSQSHTMTSTGSGVVIKSQNGMTQVLTAAHVCVAGQFQGMVIEGVVYDYTSISTVEVIDYHGSVHPAIVLNIDEKNDLCLLLTAGEYSVPVPIASEMPPIGDRVYNVAAPMGIFEPGMALMFDGYYSGEDWRNNVYYTIPAYPGSSGSAVFNGEGEIIGIIHSATMAFPHVAIASNLDAVQELVEGH